jgi:membrane protease subunit (stomatin/prohibitin family)
MANIADIIKYEGDNSTFIWKHPCEDFNTTTQLIVHESQEAIFFLNGQALDLFGPGRHTLETQNIPLLSRLLNRITGGDTPFHCEVYFINKTEQMSIKWGTDSKVQYIEPTYGFPISIGASGEMSLRAEDSRKLLLKLVGTENFLGQQKLIGFFRAFLMTRVKTYIAQTMKVNAINIFELDENLTLFSNAIYQQLIPDFADYGVSLERFFVTNVVKPDGDRQYEKFKELHFRQYADIAEAKLRQQTDLIYAQTEAQKVVIDSQAQATKRAQEGYTYQQERGFDVATEVARNEAVGQFTNLGVGLGTMAGVGGAVAGTVGGAMSDALSQTTTVNLPVKCIKCGAPLPANAKFCLECGEKVAPAIPENMVVCPKCGSTVAKGKFCPECGHKFIAACPNCGKETIPGAKFCLECGQKL